MVILDGALQSTLTSKGQATIPKEVRDHLGVQPGDGIKFFIQADGRVFILPKLPASAARGILKRRDRRATLDEIEAGIAKGATARHRRFLRSK